MLLSRAEGCNGLLQRYGLLPLDTSNKSTTKMMKTINKQNKALKLFRAKQLSTFTGVQSTNGI